MNNTVVLIGRLTAKPELRYTSSSKEVSNSKAIEEVINELTLITGQKPLTVIAKKSNASFKLREGMAMGGKVTMRRERM